MIYVISDLHGEYEKYIQMLKKIDLKENDTLYVLGDVIDRGNDGIKILFDMMQRGNVIPIMGNHEHMALCVLTKLNVEITEDNYDSQLDSKTLEMYNTWLYNGGITTSRAFSRLDKEDKAAVLEYIGEFEAYAEIEVGGKEFILVHAGLGNTFPIRRLDSYTLYELTWLGCDYVRKYFDDKYLVTGHTPTFLIDEKCDGKIYKENNHLAIDCGAVYGKKLGCICLDTFEEFYV